MLWTGAIAHWHYHNDIISSTLISPIYVNYWWHLFQGVLGESDQGTLQALIIAFVFHQFFEGLSLGTAMGKNVMNAASYCCLCWCPQSVSAIKLNWILYVVVNVRNILDFKMILIEFICTYTDWVAHELNERPFMFSRLPRCVISSL